MSVWERLWEVIKLPSESRARVLPQEQPSEALSQGINLELAELFGIASGRYEQTVTPSSAIQNTAVLACVRVLAESVASLPLKVYERTPSGKRAAVSHPLYTVLHERSNAEMSSFELRETLMAHVLLWGNAFCEIEMNQRADVLGLWPLRPDRVVVRRMDDGKLWYFVTLSDNKIVPLPAYRVLHVRGLSSNGVVGLSPIALARSAIGLSDAGQELGNRFFANNARPGGVLQHPAKLSPAAFERLRSSWEERHKGLDNLNRVAILEEGMQWKDVSMPLNDAQFLETRKFQVSEIARVFRVPLHMIGDLEHATFSNIEHQAIEFVVHSLRPWLVRIEQAISRDLIGPVERGRLFAEFSVDGLLRGDTQSRYSAYAIGRQWGWLSRNDIRGYENLDNLGPDGDDYLTPMNMTEMGEEPEPAPAAAPEPPKPAEPDAAAGVRAALQMLIDDACQRVEQRAGGREEKDKAWVAGVLRPVVRACGGGEDVVARLVGTWFGGPMTAVDMSVEIRRIAKW